MYRKYYGLREKPFELAPVGGRVYLSESHREALATLRYGVIANKGFLLLIGGVGTGKTTVLNTLLGMVKSKIRVCVLNNPKLNKHEFFTYLSGTLGIPYNQNKGSFILQFASFLKKYESEGGKVLLIIDEAQAFPINLLEEVRLLSNHAGQKNALSIFLIGQPELQEKLADPELLPLRQRIGIRHLLEPLSEKDTAQYISYRLSKAGAGNSAIFEKSAINSIHKASRGNPRLINIICDHALITGFNLDMNYINKAIIDECVKEIKFEGEKKLQGSDIHKVNNTINIFGHSFNLSKKVVTPLIVITLLTVVVLLYQYIPQTWWTYLENVTSLLLENFK